MRIKICGITNLEDALNAVEAGADALGFVFYEKSPRYIDPQIAKEIIKKLPPFVQSVGLFVNEIPAKIDFIVRQTQLDIVQAHFDIDERFIKHLQSKYIEVIRAKEKQDILNLNPNKYYLVDAFVESYGGEGKRIALDWFDEVDCSKLIIAGGLNSDNLEELEGYNFYGVDVSSGVELSKGKKDKQKIINFINKANELSS
ncbi:MAG: phosphoribosylanthranilate isomerase [Arcobacteraceae bacterium]|nr:phosphoribosylanthranilate isomerase [Arcobacteraceae bacterium]